MDKSQNLDRIWDVGYNACNCRKEVCTYSNGALSPRSVSEMARHQRVVVRITKETEHVAFGCLKNDEQVFVTSDAREAALCDAGDTLEGKYLRGAIGPNKDEERRKTTPWVFFFYNELADEEQFKTSTPPTINNEEDLESNGSEIVDPDELDDAVEDIAIEIDACIPGLDTKGLRKQVASELIDESVDPTTANFPKMVAVRLKQVKKERHDLARGFVAQILSKGAIPGLICQQSKLLIELGPEVYWQNGNHPKTIMTDIVGSDSVSEPEPEAVAATVE